MNVARMNGRPIQPLQAAPMRQPTNQLTVQPMQPTDGNSGGRGDGSSDDSGDGSGDRECNDSKRHPAAAAVGIPHTPRTHAMMGTTAQQRTAPTIVLRDLPAARFVRSA
ncbi:hypothetical protein PLESTF_000238700 [Pleodorina starrii]|nr:hypothetical protein PLESTF_000238700 [Pleodorina starrii]